MIITIQAFVSGVKFIIAIIPELHPGNLVYQNMQCVF